MIFVLVLLVILAKIDLQNFLLTYKEKNADNIIIAEQHHNESNY